MSRLRSELLRLVGAVQASESGQGLAEYALILALVALACVGALTTFGQTIRDSSAWTLP